jgi:hypothetical protein
MRFWVCFVCLYCFGVKLRVSVIVKRWAWAKCEGFCIGFVH